MIRSLICAAALSLLAAVPALAGDLSGSATITSNYISRGTAQNVDGGGGPAVQGSLTYTTDTNLYATVFASTMDFGEGTTKELDFFVGYRPTIGDYTVDLSVASINYPNNHTEWNFVEYGVKIDRPVGKGSAGVWVGYAPKYFAVFGPGWWTEAHASYPVTDKLTVSGAVANQALKNNFDYRTWNIGATYAVTPNLFFDVRYADTDRLDLDPIYDTYDDSVSVSLTATF